MDDDQRPSLSMVERSLPRAAAALAMQHLSLCSVQKRPATSPSRRPPSRSASSSLWPGRMRARACELLEA
eukprot:5629827-Pyramimonas_sp.AAC.1